MKFTILLVVALISLGALSACGQSGPLYVPGDPSSVQKPQPVPESDDQSEENGDDDEG